jgi:hypothetical protein
MCENKNCVQKHIAKLQNRECLVSGGNCVHRLACGRTEMSQVLRRSARSATQRRGFVVVVAAPDRLEQDIGSMVPSLLSGRAVVPNLWYVCP